MKYNILINQKAITELNAGVKSDDQLDLKDATILEWMMVFHAEPKAKKLLRDNVVYFWASYRLILDENPLLFINNKEVLKRRIDKLIAHGLLLKEMINETHTYFSITQKAFETIKHGVIDIELPSTEKSKGFDLKVEAPSTKKSNNNIYNNNSHNNKNSVFAFEFLKENNQMMWERLMMEFGKQPSINKIVDHFNMKFEEEQKDYVDKVIFGRFRRFALNYIANEQKNQPEEEKPYVYLRKIS